MAIRKMSLGLVILFGLAACFLYGVGAGLRSDIGILLQPILGQTGLSYDQVSFCIAVMQLVFGFSQPLFGLLAAKRSNRFVLLLGTLLIMTGLWGIRVSYTFTALLLSLSGLFGLGVGAMAFGLIYTSAVYFVGSNNAMLIAGMLNAAAGMLGFIFAPLLQYLLSAGGLSYAMLGLILLAAVMLPVIFIVTSRDLSLAERRKQGSAQVSVLALLREAGTNRTYQLLIAGFATCGFHMVIIESHLFSQFVSYGIPGDAASWAFSVYGIATIAGALLSGLLSTRLPKGRLLVFTMRFAQSGSAYIFLLCQKHWLPQLYFLSVWD